MIILQYRDRYGTNYLTHTYQDERWQDALYYYRGTLKAHWEETRLLLADNENDQDWVILEDDSLWWLR